MLSRAAMQDPVVHAMVRAGYGLEEIIEALIVQKKALTEQVVQLWSIAPFRIKTPDGKTYTWRCPDGLVPIKDAILSHASDENNQSGSH